jgi:plasmid stabilization system protein ParE
MRFSPRHVRAPIRAAAEYRLSPRTRGDLVDIYVFSQANFGRYQADAYYAGQERTFGLIADFPGIGINSDELVVGYRRFRFALSVGPADLAEHRFRLFVRHAEHLSEAQGLGCRR